MLTRSGVWRWIWSERFLFSSTMLLLLFLVNAGGTIYGYMWYWKQLVETYETMNRWLLPFVPDSPTASLFFTLSLLFMIVDRVRPVTAGNRIRIWRYVRGIIDALAVITLVKYGIWAVAMIFAQGYQGVPIDGQQWMLVASHTGMVVQAIIYSKFMRFGIGAIAAAAIWSFTNDYLDYHLGIFPWLSKVLHDDLAAIELFTISLGAASVILAAVLYKTTAMRTRI